ncbi:acyltransferase [Nocardioides mangrovicus]|uniref:Acyltransferase n=1 Tax=Nocardioides mangrovicus TaxID=2478913 RepID=A0A3L8NXR4_9ACTN|nr:acyltransferase [Nocardioides mangrovicus]RLV47631.1 acyltransferase [Nocardioides mangrovicus]
MTLRAGLRWHLGRARTAATRHRFAALGPGTVIVRPHALRGLAGVSIGRDCAIYEDVWLQCEAGGTLSIGDHTYLGNGVHLHAIDPVSIGSGCVLADGVFVASADHDRVDRHRVHGSGPVVIGDDVFLGQRAVVLGGVTIGDGATVGAHAVVTRDVAPGQVVGGVPARPLGSTS